MARPGIGRAVGRGIRTAPFIQAQPGLSGPVRGVGGPAPGMMQQQMARPQLSAPPMTYPTPLVMRPPPYHSGQGPPPNMMRGLPPPPMPQGRANAVCCKARSAALPSSTTIAIWAEANGATRSSDERTTTATPSYRDATPSYSCFWATSPRHATSTKPSESATTAQQ